MSKPTRSFIFDIIIIKISTPASDITDPKLLTANVEFNRESIQLTSKSINVLDFPQGKSYAFTAKVKELRTQMMEKPIEMIVKYDGNIFGSAFLKWPSSIYENVKESCEELSHFGECDLFNEEKKIGILEVKIRLQAKCEGQQDDKMEATCEDYRNNIEKIIDPGDVFFVVEGGPQIDCGGVEDDEEAPTLLDLSRYRTVNGQIIKSVDIVNACQNGCCELQDCKAYNNLLNVLCGKNKEKEEEDPLADIQKMCDDLTTNYACKAKKHVPECPHHTKFSDDEDLECHCCPCCQRCMCDCKCRQECRKKPGPYNPITNVCSTRSGVKMVQADCQRQKICPICNLDVSWLPNMAACPSCGYKPVPYVEEKPYNADLTTDQILKGYCRDEESKSSSSSSEDEKQREQQKRRKRNRCKCENGKVCAHCRIKSFLHDLLEPKSLTCKKPNEKTAVEPKLAQQKSESDLGCTFEDSDKSRIFLSRVFSELRDLHDIKTTTKKKKLRDADLCGPKGKLGRRSGGADEPPDNEGGKGNGKNVGSGDGDENNESGKSSKNKKGRLQRSDFEVQNYNEQVKKKFCKKRGKKYVYNRGKVYPDLITGHQPCTHEAHASRRPVPADMGWLWNIGPYKRGWKPGAIRKPIKEIMKYFLRDFPADTITVSRYGKYKPIEQKPEILVQEPTLHIAKKQGEYVITMKPLKPTKLLQFTANPYLDMKPIRFRITKNPLIRQMRELKAELKELGFEKCSCHKPVKECFCRNFLEKKKLEFEIGKQCQNRLIPNVKDTLVLTDTSESEDEVDFGITPPVGLIKLCLAKKPDLVHVETQYQTSDWDIKPVISRPHNRFMFPPYDGAKGAPKSPFGNLPGMNLPPGFVFPPNFKPPANFKYPPGFKLPPGVKLPPGMPLPPGEAEEKAKEKADKEKKSYGPRYRYTEPPPHCVVKPFITKFDALPQLLYQVERRGKPPVPRPCCCPQYPPYYGGAGLPLCPFANLPCMKSPLGCVYFPSTDCSDPSDFEFPPGIRLPPGMPPPIGHIEMKPKACKRKAEKICTPRYRYTEPPAHCCVKRFITKFDPLPQLLYQVERRGKPPVPRPYCCR